MADIVWETRDPVFYLFIYLIILQRFEANKAEEKPISCNQTNTYFHLEAMISS